MLVTQMQAAGCAVRKSAGRIVAQVNDQDRFVPCDTEANGAVKSASLVNTAAKSNASLHASLGGRLPNSHRSRFVLPPSRFWVQVPILSGEAVLNHFCKRYRDADDGEKALSSNSAESSFATKKMHHCRT